MKAGDRNEAVRLMAGWFLPLYRWSGLEDQCEVYIIREAIEKAGFWNEKVFQDGIKYSKRVYGKTQGRAYCAWLDKLTFGGAVPDPRKRPA